MGRRCHRVHKLLTGRRNQFRRNPPLRRRDGEEMPFAGQRQSGSTKWTVLRPCSSTYFAPGMTTRVGTLLTGGREHLADRFPEPRGVAEEGRYIASRIR